MFKRFAIPTAVFAVLVVLPAASSAATVAQVLGNPSTYEHPRRCYGHDQTSREKISHKGNAYVTFVLCSSQCIHVFAFGSPNISDGQKITVHGTFAAVKHVGGYTFYNEIDADDGSL